MHQEGGDVNQGQENQDQIKDDLPAVVTDHPVKAVGLIPVSPAGAFLPRPGGGG